MSASVLSKTRSYEYGEAYQRQQLEKHRNRQSNHWRPRITLAHELVDQYVLPKFQGRQPQELTVLDIGCSIGTMSIEFARRGFRVFGVDFDPAALALARELCQEEGVEVEFVRADIAEWQQTSNQAVDIAVCFDIFEHLHDDELGALLQAVRRALSPDGALVFHTFPTQFNYLFFSRRLPRVPLLPFARLPVQWFSRIVNAYAAVLDAGLILVSGEAYRDRIKKEGHCNPTTAARLRDILERAGYSVVFIRSGQIYPFMGGVQRWFRKQPIADRNLYGVAVPQIQ